MEINIKFQGSLHQLTIDKSHYVRRLGYPKDYEVSEDIEESMKCAAEWYQEHGDPWLQIYEVDIDLKDEKIYLNGIETQAPKVYSRFKKHHVEKALLIASTAGINVDKESMKLWSLNCPDTAFFLGTYAASVAESLVNFAITYCKDWCHKKGMKTLSRYSPGYPGWDLKEQFLLMDIIQKESKEPIPITISETSLLTPLKSQFSLVGVYNGEISEKQIDIECAQCTFIDCSCKDKGIFVREVTPPNP